MSEYTLQLAEKESRVRDLLSPFTNKGEPLLPLDVLLPLNNITDSVQS